MEKKNMVLLTIIAVATLLVAVVGATFAYFTAAVGGTGNTTNNTTTVKTVVLAGVDYEGSSVFAPTTAEAYPGLKGVQSFTIKLPANTPAEATGRYKITLTPNVPTQFASDITYTLYKTTTSDEIVRTPGTIQQDGNNYYVNDTLSAATENMSVVKTGTLTGTAVVDLETVDYTGTFPDTTYFITYEYANNGAQNDQMGLTFTSTINVELLPQN